MQCMVALGVAERVIDQLELIEVEIYEHGIDQSSSIDFEHEWGRHLKSPPVAEAREGIGHRHVARRNLVLDHLRQIMEGLKFLRR